jgi:uncharacterized damage-inducible protein DinB
MEQFTTLLEEALEAWEDVRMGVIEELRNIPEDKFDFRPAKDTRTVRELAIHILEVAMMMTGELTRGDTNLTRAPWPELLDTYASAAYRLKTKGEILSFMQKQLNNGMEKFREAGELHMLQLMRRFDGKMGTRYAWFQHGIEQEMYHRGQLTVYARLMGLEPALTKVIKGES